MSQAPSINVPKLLEVARAPAKGEGIPLRRYRLFELIAALPISVALDAYLALVRRTARESAPAETVPPRALVVLFHREWPITPATGWFRRLWTTQSGAFLGFHGFLSYLLVTWSWRLDLAACRYDRKRDQMKPSETVKRYLATSDAPFFMRTDAGGPYDKVRASAIDLALASGRPLVGIRQRASRAVRLLGHFIPLPGTMIETRLTQPLSLAELQALGRDKARDEMQRRMEELFKA